MVSPTSRARPRAGRLLAFTTPQPARRARRRPSPTRQPPSPTTQTLQTRSVAMRTRGRRSALPPSSPAPITPKAGWAVFGAARSCASPIETAGIPRQPQVCSPALDHTYCVAQRETNAICQIRPPRPLPLAPFPRTLQPRAVSALCVCPHPVRTVINKESTLSNLCPRYEASVHMWMHWAHR